MAAVPVIIHGVFMPSAKDADSQPIKGTLIGYASIQGLEVGGGPIIPPDGSPVDPPIDPPGQPDSGLAVVIKPAPVTGGWGLASQGGELQWFFAPAKGGPGPKNR